MGTKETPHYETTGTRKEKNRNRGTTLDGSVEKSTRVGLDGWLGV